jgi:hypothetical protein
MGESRTAESVTDTEPGALPDFEDLEDPDPDVVITGDASYSRMLGRIWSVHPTRALRL